jgi:hypothetical protein
MSRSASGAGIPVTDIREVPKASYAMAQGPDNLLLELFQPNPDRVSAELVRIRYFATVRGA